MNQWHGATHPPIARCTTLYIRYTLKRDFSLLVYFSPARRWRVPRTIRQAAGVVDQPSGVPWSAVTYLNIRDCLCDGDVLLSTTYGRDQVTWTRALPGLHLGKEIRDSHGLLTAVRLPAPRKHLADDINSLDAISLQYIYCIDYFIYASYPFFFNNRSK